MLVIRLGAIGDVVRTLPAVSALRSAYAGARMARMLARGGQYQAAVKLAGRLLKNPLPPKLRRHIEQSGVYAHKKRKAAKRPGA